MASNASKTGARERTRGCVVIQAAGKPLGDRAGAGYVVPDWMSRDWKAYPESRGLREEVPASQNLVNLASSKRNGGPA